MPKSPNSVPDLVDIVDKLNKRIIKLELGQSGGDLPDPTSSLLSPLTVSGLTVSNTTRYLEPIRQTPRVSITWTWTDESTTVNTNKAFDGPKNYMVAFTSPNNTTVRWQLVSTNSYTRDNLPLNTSVTLKVVAVSWSGRLGPYASSTVNTSFDSSAPIQPATPTVTAELKGIRVAYNGKDVNGITMAADTEYVEVHVSTGGATFTPSSTTFVTRVSPTGCNIVLVQPSYVQYWVRLVAYDTSGNASVASTAGSATPLKAIGTDLGIALPGDIAFRDEGNLVLDGSFESATFRTDRLAHGGITGTVTFDSTAGMAKHGTWCVKHDGDATTTKQMYLQNNSMDNAFEIPVSAYTNQKLYVSCQIRGISGNGTASIVIRWTDAAGVTSFTTPFSTATSTGAYVLFEAIVVVPATAVTMNIRTNTANQTVGQWYFDALQVRNVIGTALIEDAAITNAKIALLAVQDANIDTVNVGKLTAGSIAAGETIIAGDPLSSNAQMKDTGYYVYTVDVDGNVIEAVRMGTVDNDVFAISDATGETVASIDEGGYVSGTGLNIDAEDITVGGEVLLGALSLYETPSEVADLGTLDKIPRGIVGFGSWQGDNTTTYTQNQGLFDVSFEAKRGRTYAVYFSGCFAAATQANVTTGFHVRCVLPSSIGAEANKPTPATGTNVGQSWGSVPTAGAQIYFPEVVRIMRCNQTGDTSVGGELIEGTCRVGLFVRGDRAGGVRPSTDIVALYIVDLGPDVPIRTVINDSTAGGSGTTTTAVKTYQKTYLSTGWGTYRSINAAVRGTNSSVGDTGSHIFQGYSSPSSYNGDQEGLWIFPSMTADLSGATVNKIEVYLYANHWYYNSGGSALIKVHGYTSVPSVNPSMTTAVTSSSWPNPGGRWVTLPNSFYAGFKSGTYRGCGVGPAGTTNVLYYGYFAAGAKIRVTYTK